MKAQLISCRYEPAVPGNVITGYKDGKAPKKGYGCNGSFRLPDIPPKMEITFENLATGSTHTGDIYYCVKKQLHAQDLRITKKRATKIFDYLKKHKFEIAVDQLDNWIIKHVDFVDIING